jgi:pimeloyl-ACP methyl ester carboxylesterase
MVRSSQALHSWYMAFFQLPLLPELGYSERGVARTRALLRRTGLPDDAADRYLATMRQPGAARAAVNWYRAIPFAGRPTGPVTVPALYVYATGDTFLGRAAAELTARYVAAPYRFEVLEGATHWLPECNADEVARLVLEYARAHGA